MSSSSFSPTDMPLLFPVTVVRGSSESSRDDSSTDGDGGLTPTTKEISSSGGGVDGWLTDLIQDLDLATSGSSSSSQQAFSPSPFRNPTEANAYLKSNPRTDVNLATQRHLIEEHHSESLKEAVLRWQREKEMVGVVQATEAHHLIALKVLVHEAANRSLRTLLGDTKLRTFCAWKNIEENVVCHAWDQGWQSSQRILSCMCIFDPALTASADQTAPMSSVAVDGDIPLPPVFGENSVTLARRRTRQVQTIRTLKLQRAVHLRRGGHSPIKEAGGRWRDQPPHLFITAPGLGSCSGQVAGPGLAPMRSMHQLVPAPSCRSL